MVNVVKSKDKRIPKGAQIVSINEQSIDDELEWRFYNDIDTHRTVLIKINGTKKNVNFSPGMEIFVDFEPTQYRSCENNCEFCFINGLPPGLRKELYFRDDDYRLSFLYGNFLSMTNIHTQDLKRITRLRLSPLYISVHTTLKDRRVKLFQNKRAGCIMDQLRQLVNANITLHCQVVVIPGQTNGLSLNRTIDDLSTLYPGVRSIGIVPVGKSRYSNTYSLVTIKDAAEIIKLAEGYQQTFRKKYNRGLVYCADEFFIAADNPIPSRRYYDDLPQFENGIGMVRHFIDEINSLTTTIHHKGKIAFLTGHLAFPYVHRLREKLTTRTLSIDVIPVKNSIFGDTVTVAGLLGGKDFQRAINNFEKPYDFIILPPSCVNNAGQFIDDYIIDDKRVLIAPAGIRNLITCLQ